MASETNGTGDSLNRRNYLALAGGATLLGTGLAGCAAPSGTETTEQSGTTMAAEGNPWTAELDVDREFWTVLNEFGHRRGFFPSTALVNQGEQVGIHLKNTGDEPHDFIVSAFDVAAENISEGSALTRSFTADAPGVHSIKCDIHPTWMWGQFVALPDAGTSIPTVDERTLRIVTSEIAHRESFFPSTNVVVEGEQVTVQLKNTGKEPHDFEVPGLDVSKEDIEPGTQLDDFTVAADEPGIYDIKCQRHPSWMWGQLVVLPADGDYSRMSGEGNRTLRMVTGGVGGRESFFPATNVAKKGEEITVRVKNAGEEAHDLNVEAFDVATDLDPGEQKEVSFTASEAGIHPIVCEFHPPEMRGQLWVVP